jgi:hypothetical protein
MGCDIAGAMAGRMARGRPFVLALSLGWAGIATAEPLPYRALTQDFSDFATATADQPMTDRVRAFRAHFGKLFPAFYRPRDGRSPADYDRIVAQALSDFPAQRAGYDTVTRAFPTVFAQERDRFRATFPSFRLNGPVYLLHSLGEMDGGTRTIGKRRVLIFAADGIATIDTPDSTPMLLTHEFFPSPTPAVSPAATPSGVPCGARGWATYAAATLHPAATDRQISLEYTVPTRPAVDKHWRDAVCLLHARLDTSGSASTHLFFRSDGGTKTLPPRFGYYLGYRIVQRVAAGRSLPALMALPMRPAHALLHEQVTAMAAEAGGCTAPTFADFVANALLRPASSPAATHPQ